MRPARQLRIFAGQSENLRDLLGRERAGIAAAWPIVEHGGNRAPQVGRVLRALEHGQAWPHFGPASPPQADEVGRPTE